MLSYDVSVADPTRSSKAKPSELSQVGVQENKREGPLYLHVNQSLEVGCPGKEAEPGGRWLFSAEAVFLSLHRG